MDADRIRLAVRSAIAATQVDDLLTSKPAVVLERIARGAGATKWYFCPRKASLEVIEARLSPGSLISFYFDEQIRSAAYSETVRSEIEEIIATTGEAVVGALTADGIRIDVDFVTGPNDLADFLSAVGPGSRIFYGVFPGQENDGQRGITLVVPDADGMVRRHPH